MCDENLLEIICNCKNIGRLQEHFKKMFAGITAILLNVITGIASKEGEEDKFVTPVSTVDYPRWASAASALLSLSCFHAPSARINEWPSHLEHHMRVSLATAVASVVEAGRQMVESGEVVPTSMMDWLDGFPTQISVISTQVPPCSMHHACLIFAHCSPCSLCS